MKDAIHIMADSMIPDPESRFTGLPLELIYIDGIDWIIKGAVTYRTEAGEHCTVRRGFVFDFASVPRPLYCLYPPAGTKGNPYGVAALVHDWLYVHRKIDGRPITRREADAVFYEIMRYVGCRRTLAYAMWIAVRVGGWIPWMRRKQEDVIP